jgi:hypothetical protein
VSERTASGDFVTQGRGEARCSRRILSLSAVIFNSMPQFFSATQSGPPQSETIPPIVLESENQSAVLAQLKMLKFFALTP